MDFFLPLLTKGEESLNTALLGRREGEGKKGKEEKAFAITFGWICLLNNAKKNRRSPLRVPSSAQVTFWNFTLSYQLGDREAGYRLFWKLCGIVLRAYLDSAFQTVLPRAKGCPKGVLETRGDNFNQRRFIYAPVILCLNEWMIPWLGDRLKAVS